MLRQPHISHRQGPVVKVFLGGTCMNTTWREKVKERISCAYFDPFIKDGEWTEEHYKKELEERKLLCSHMVYVITPQSKGFYAIAELMEDSILRPKQTYVCFLNGEEGEPQWDEDQVKSVNKTIEAIRHYHGNICDNLDDLVKAINSIA